MPGSFTIAPGSIPLARPARIVGVYRRNAPGDFALLPNVRVLSIDTPKEGADPGSARFRYAFGDPLGDPNDPQRFEQVTSLAIVGPHIVEVDDRLVVRGFREDGSSDILFDGFARNFQADLNSTTESVTFEAFGTPIREWETVFGGPVTRDADDPATVADIQVAAGRTRFNPDGHPNMSPEGADSGSDPDKYPVFLGPVWPSNEINGSTILPWTLEGAVRHVIALGNPDREWTTYPPLSGLVPMLVAIRARPEDGVIDWQDTSTYDIEDIIVEDLDITGAVWPEALERLLQPHGFAMRFRLTEEPGEDANAPTEPKWELEIYRRDDLARVKSVYLQLAGETYNPAKTNLRELRLARDTMEVESHVALQTAPTLYEASFVLAPFFETDPADVNTLELFEGENAPETYRVWVFDECGEGHLDISDDNWIVGEPGEFDNVLLADPVNDVRNFAVRRRPGIAKLISKDEKGEAKRAQLHYSKDYAGPMPGVHDGSGTWVEVNAGDWALLDDRLGIRINEPKINAWKAGKIKDGDPDPYDNGGVVQLVEWCANPTTAHPFIRFRLTCVIEADVDLGIESPWREASSITERPILRLHDVRDRFRKRVVSKHSALKAAGATTDEAVEDDGEEARGYANAIRRARETGSFAGSFTLNGIRLAYEVGDKVDHIVGRDISLRQNLGENQGESAVYPTIVSLRWDFDGEQKTLVQLSDVRAEPPARRRKVHESV